MKTVYKVKVSIKIGDIESKCHAEIHTDDDDKDDGIVNEMKFESVEEYIKWRAERQIQDSQILGNTN
jgi:hypothetical protein